MSRNFNYSQIYHNIYALICGRNPRQRPWHFQWLSTLYLHRSLSHILPKYGGNVLDVGCGDKPYRTWFGETSEYVGLDMVAGPEVDLVLKRGEKWPLQDERYDVLLSTQVIEHVDDLEFLVKEMSRVLKSDGVIILSFPFIYNVHGEPHDYRRLTTYGAKELLSDFEIVHMEAQGGIGSTLVVLFLNWLNAELSLSGIGKLVKGIILPLFIPASLVLNLLGLVLDQLDHTNIFYSGIILIARKR